MAKAASENDASGKNQKYEQHQIPLQYVPGDMTDEQFVALCDDIKRQGQQLPITLFEGKILDGWQRYRACNRVGVTPKYTEYGGDDPIGLVIALNVLRRNTSSTQRAMAGARLNLEHNITQDEASKRVGVSKVHINVVVQALKSKNARIIKMLETHEMTREQLIEELVESGIMKPSSHMVASRAAAEAGAAISAAAATSGLEGFFKSTAGQPAEDEDDLGLGDTSADDDDLDFLGAPPTAGGKILDKVPSRIGGPDTPGTGTRPSHPERRSKDTPAYQLAEKLKAMPEPERIAFVQIAWPIIRPLIKPAGVSVEIPTAVAAVADTAIAKAASTAKAAASKPEKAPRKAKAAKATEAGE